MSQICCVCIQGSYKSSSCCLSVLPVSRLFYCFMGKWMNEWMNVTCWYSIVSRVHWVVRDRGRSVPPVTTCCGGSCCARRGPEAARRRKSHCSSLEITQQSSSSSIYSPLTNKQSLTQSRECLQRRDFSTFVQYFRKYISETHGVTRHDVSLVVNSFILLLILCVHCVLHLSILHYIHLYSP